MIGLMVAENMDNGLLDEKSLFALTRAKHAGKQARILAKMGIPFLQSEVNEPPQTTWQIINEVLRSQIKLPTKKADRRENVNLNLKAIEEFKNGKKKNSKPGKPA